MHLLKHLGKTDYFVLPESDGVCAFGSTRTRHQEIALEVLLPEEQKSRALRDCHEHVDTRSLIQLLNAYTGFVKILDGRNVGSPVEHNTLIDEYQRKQSSDELKVVQSVIEEIPIYAGKLLQPKVPDFLPIDFSSVAQALQAAGLGHGPVFTQILCSAQGQFTNFTDREISNLVNAIAKANRKHEMQFFEMMYHSLHRAFPDFAPQALVTLLNACSKLDLRSQFLLDGLTNEVMHRSGKFNEAEVALLCNACSNLGKNEEKLIRFLASQIEKLADIKKVRHVAMFVKAFTSQKWTGDTSGPGDNRIGNSSPDLTASTIAGSEHPRLPISHLAERMVRRVTSHLPVYGQSQKISSMDLSDISLGIQFMDTPSRTWLFEAVERYLKDAEPDRGQNIKTSKDAFSFKDMAIIATSLTSAGISDHDLWNKLAIACETHNSDDTKVDIATLVSFAKAFRKISSLGEPFSSLSEKTLLHQCLGLPTSIDRASDKHELYDISESSALKNALHSAQIHDVVSLFHSVSSVLSSKTDPKQVMYSLTRLYLSRILDEFEDMAAADVGLALSAFCNLNHIVANRFRVPHNAFVEKLLVRLAGSNVVSGSGKGGAVGATQPNDDINASGVPGSNTSALFVNTNYSQVLLFSPKEVVQLLRDLRQSELILGFNFAKQQQVKQHSKYLLSRLDLNTDLCLELLNAVPNRDSLPSGIMRHIEMNFETDCLKKNQSQEGVVMTTGLSRLFSLMNSLARLDIKHEQLLDQTMNWYGLKAGQTFEAAVPILHPDDALELVVGLAHFGCRISDAYVAKNLLGASLSSVFRKGRSTRQICCMISSLALFQHMSRHLGQSVFQRRLLDLYAGAHFELSSSDFEYRQLLLMALSYHHHPRQTSGKWSLLSLKALRVLVEVAATEFSTDPPTVSALQRDVAEATENLAMDIYRSSLEASAHPYSIDVLLYKLNKS